jgi:ribonuclease T1
VFTNAERILPRQAAGYYREYTVRTPGSSDRGARRLVVGRGGDVYHTEDHYASFRQVLR